jgi:glycosyltransferase involved in cell wall biosynthesis
VAANLPEVLEVSREREMSAYAQADAVLASSEADATTIRGDLPSPSEVFVFDVGVYPTVAVNGDQLHGSLSFLGNFLHPPNVDAVDWWLAVLAPEVDRFLKRPLPLRVIGSWAESLLERHAGCERLDIVGWVPRLEEELCRCRVFVAPIRYGAGTKDKISMAMRFGIPTVTTSIGAESMPASLVDALEIHDEPSAFAGTVARLMSDDARWREVAASTRKAAAAAWRRQFEARDRFPRWMREVIDRGRVR